MNEKPKPPLIKLRAVTKTYGNGAAAVDALAGINLAIEEGEFVAIMGPSGSGKSTVMNIIGCLDTPTTGDYFFQGVEIGRLAQPAGLATPPSTRLRVPGLQPARAHDGSGERRIAADLSRHARWRKRQELAAQALDRVGLAGRGHHTSTELSGGQQQRVAIARAIVTNPMVLLADEPTGNLDTKTSREIMALLTSLNRDRGNTIVMVTHEPDIAAFAGRIIHFLDGRIESDAPNRQVA